MWKSFCLAAGIFASIVGIEMLLIDSAMIRPLDGRGGDRMVIAPDWAPWALLSVGAATVLHYVSLPRVLSGRQ